MVRPHTKNGLLKDGKNNIKMKTNGEPGDRMTKKTLLNNVHSNIKVSNVKDSKKLALNRKAWNDLVEKAKTRKRSGGGGQREGGREEGRRRRRSFLLQCESMQLGRKVPTFLQHTGTSTLSYKVSHLKECNLPKDTINV
jgi:hypothetical protein